MLCCTMHCQRGLEENPQTCPFLDFVTLPEDRAIGNMRRKIGRDRACGSGVIILVDRQTDRQTDTHTQRDALITILRRRSPG